MSPNVFDEYSQGTVNTVVVCSHITKVSENIVPHPNRPQYYADLHICNAGLDYAIYNLRPHHPNMTPIPVCPSNQLPGPGFPSIHCYYGAISDFLVGEFANLAIWRGGPYSILHYGENIGEDIGCRLFTEHGLCRGSSGGAMVTNEHVVAMHLASLRQGTPFESM
jgi:hypothetical protein